MILPNECARNIRLLAIGAAPGVCAALLYQAFGEAFVDVAFWAISAAVLGLTAHGIRWVLHSF